MKEEIQALKESLTDIQSSIIWALKEIEDLAELKPTLGDIKKDTYREFLDDCSKGKIPGGRPKAPTHEEIMTKWWLNTGDEEWLRITAFDWGEYHGPRYAFTYGGAWFSPRYFIGRQSADIPPEGEKT